MALLRSLLLAATALVVVVAALEPRFAKPGHKMHRPHHEQRCASPSSTRAGSSSSSSSSSSNNNSNNAVNALDRDDLSAAAAAATATTSASSSTTHRATIDQRLPEQFLRRAAATGTLRAGAAKIDGSLPIGTPGAGYNHGARRVSDWPLFKLTKYTSWMTPMQGIRNPSWVKALYVSNGDEALVFVTFDVIGMGGKVPEEAWLKAREAGSNVTFEQVMFSASHSHSGPGGINPDFLWEFAPATDLFVPELWEMLTAFAAQAIVDAERAAVPAKVGVEIGELVGVTRNRRYKESPYLNETTIDPHLGVIAVDAAADNTPIATLWNFAVHGTCYGPDNLLISGDIMGVACTHIERLVGGNSVALFMNADAGDIDPTNAACAAEPDFAGSAVMAAAVATTRANATMYTEGRLRSYAYYYDFGPANLNLTLSRLANCTHGGPLDICSLCATLDCTVPVHLYSSWLETEARFSAFALELGGRSTAVVSMPGEPLLQLGWWVRNDTAHTFGFDNTLLAGYTNDHLGYFATPREYVLGGYESTLTFFGINTADRVREAVRKATEQVLL